MRPPSICADTNTCSYVHMCAHASFNTNTHMPNTSSHWCMHSLAHVGAHDTHTSSHVC
jgi:hypothetical protein